MAFAFMHLSGSASQLINPGSVPVFLTGWRDG